MTTVAQTHGEIAPQHQELWRQLQNFDFDQGGTRGAFARRLAKDHYWDREFTDLVIGEYRKFLFLMKTAGRMVTPALAVDEVWHLHLLFTQSYWVALCDEIFHQPMHHHPGDGSKADDEKYAAIYQRTLEYYRSAFGDPPASIWGPHKQPRFHWRNIPCNLNRWFRFFTGCGQTRSAA